MKDVELQLGLDQQDNISEDMFLKAIEDRVYDLMQRDMELLMSYLYRLDIKEADIKHALSLLSIHPPHEGLALLIAERQKQRIATKKAYPQKPIKGWEF